MKSRVLSVFDGDPCADDLTPRDGLSAESAARVVAEALRSRQDPADREFDRFLPRSLEVVSGQFWTPLEVATRVADWLDEFNIATVVDVGSGVGKFCIAAALSGRCSFTGIEQRARLVRAARHLARLFRVEDRVHFVTGTFAGAPLPLADAYYLYNPFGENRFTRDAHLDEEVELTDERYWRDVSSIEASLAATPIGTFVIMYNGFGGNLPESYKEVRVDRELPNVLRIARKIR